MSKKEKNQPLHYDDVKSLFAFYRTAKDILTNNSKETIDKLDSNELFKQNYEKAEKVVRLVDNAIMRINFVCKDGSRCAKILFYRYMTEQEHTEQSIIDRLKYEGVAKSKPTYHRLKEKGLYAACAFIYGDEVDISLKKEVNIPSYI